MLELNLVPESYFKAKRMARILAVAIGGGILLIAILAMFYVYTMSQISNLKGDISRVELEKKKYAKTLADIELLNSKTKAVEERLKSIDELQEQQALWILLVDDFGKCVPNNLWVISLNNKREAGGTRTFSCSGISLFKEVIADLLVRLNSSKFYRNVSLSTMAETTSAGLRAYNFRITFTSIEDNKVLPQRLVGIKEAGKTGIFDGTYVNTTLGCSLSKSEGWNISDKTPLPNMLAVITRERKQNSGKFSPNVTLASERLKEQFKDSKLYALSVEESLKKTVQGYGRISEREIFIKNLRCYETVIIFRSPSRLESGKQLEIKQRRVYFVKNNTGFVISCTDATSGFESGREDFESIINTFRVL